MKRSFRTLGILALASGLALTSCKKDIETSDFTLDQSKQGTVKAYVYAELNMLTNGKEYAPDGTMVILSIDASELNGKIAAGVSKWIDTVTVKNGMIEKNVPTTNKGVTVTLIANEITRDQTQSYENGSTKITKYFSVSANPTVTVYPNQTASTTVNYNQENLTSIGSIETVTCTVKLAAELNDKTDPDVIPSTTEINLYTNSWHLKLNPTDNKLTGITIPKNAGDITIEFITTQTVADVKKTYLFRGILSTQPTSTVTPISVNCSIVSPWDPSL